MIYELDIKKFKAEYSEYDIKNIISAIAIRDEWADDKYVYDILANYGNGELKVFANNELTENMKNSLLRKA